ncbi:hypothetical protein H5410_021472, partial [Solanum commersonii]
MKQNQDNMQLELLQMRQFMQKHASNESMPQNINGISIHDADGGHGQIAQTKGIPSVVENTPTSHGITHLYPS